MKVEAYLGYCQQRVNKALTTYLTPTKPNPQALAHAMQYAVLNGGKRIRAALAYATGEALGAKPALLDTICVAIEIVHAFTLVHDDLPALDNDDLRRGKPACHKAFSEATAILAGDALQTLAFDILLQIPATRLPSTHLITMLKLLTKTIGIKGLAGGQAFDIAMTHQPVTLRQLFRAYKMKTADFITASIMLGALAADCHNPMALHTLRRFGDKIGLAFQIRDDIIGIETHTDKLGKTQDSDKLRMKPTIPSLLGLPAAKKIEQQLFSKAMNQLQTLTFDTRPLAALSTYLLNRDV